MLLRLSVFGCVRRTADEQACTDSLGVHHNLNQCGRRALDAPLGWRLVANDIDVRALSDSDQIAASRECTSMHGVGARRQHAQQVARVSRPSDMTESFSSAYQDSERNGR
jgi:hypothetical protein